MLTILAPLCHSGSAAEPLIPASETPLANIKVRTTAYTHDEPNGGGRFAATGCRLRYGGSLYSAASDWAWLPLGTIFRMPGNGRTYIIEDYGSALVGRKTIDLYSPNAQVMNAWGVRHVGIEILKLGSFAKSLSMLEPRQRHGGHVRRMVAALRKRQTGEFLLASTASTAAQ